MMLLNIGLKSISAPPPPTPPIALVKACVIRDFWRAFFSQFFSPVLKINNYFFSFPMMLTIYHRGII